jgi:ubiquinone/menaquinone biosynthesis C-methylase UbiE
MIHGSNCIESQFSWTEVLEIWKKFIPPIRPSIKEQRIYEHYFDKIKNRRNVKVLILGVTPELRNLVSKSYCNCIVIDFHSVMIKAMNHIIKESRYNRGNKEFVIKGDWFCMPFQSHEFDLILGDCSLNSLRRNELGPLFEELGRLLKIDSYLCMRIVTIPNKLQRQRICDIFEMNRMKNQVISQNIFEDLYLQILFSVEAYNTNTKRSSISKARKEWRKLYFDNKIAKQEYEAFEGILSKGEYAPLILRRNELEDLFKNYFHIIHIKNKDSNGGGYSPIYCLKSKS